jgi:formate dehydrogenase beta subunit
MAAPGAEARAGRFPGPSLIPALTAIQRRCGWLPREELVALARDVRRPLYEIEGLISFYPHFRTSPGEDEPAACHDLSCWLHGADERVAEVGREVSCLGRCDTAPAASTDEFTATRRDEPWPNDPYAPGEERYRTLTGSIEGVIDEVEASGLRGMGGAGFPTGKKWALVAAQEAQPKYAICNADESEPGTFKDRDILATQPHLVLEGLALGMLAVGASEGWVFIRHEYGPEEEVIRAELEVLRSVVGDRLRIEVFTSPGGYILGEEAALIECMEGHRGEPRNKPPFPGTHGLWGKPTLMNSVETLAAVPGIVLRGADWWRSQGVRGGTGLKFFSVSGHVARPGVYCVPMGTTARELLELAGGVTGELQAFQPGGASSNFLGPEELDVPLDFDPLLEAGSMLGSGALVAVAEGTPLLEAATNVLRFFRNESCGKCVPCRVGSHKAHTLLTARLAEGDGSEVVDGAIEGLEETLRMTSICGLGQVALGPVLSAARLERRRGR